MNVENKKDFKWDFFIAHAGADKAHAEKLYSYLCKNARVFLDSKNLKLGDDWDIELPKHQKKSYVTVILVSSKTEKAYYQREEIAAAISLAREDSQNYRAIPVYLDSEAEKNMPYGLRIKHGVTISDNCTLKDIAIRLLDEAGLGDTLKPKEDLKIAVKLPPNNLPHKRNLYFTGRYDIFKQINNNFHTNSGEKVLLTQSIAGLGGVGKSSVALEYAYRYSHEYDIIWWINAETEQTALNDIKGFALEKKLIEEDVEDNRLILREVQKWLNENEKWLFIYDNADSDDFDKWLEKCLPQYDMGHIIITTRSSYFPQSKRINIDLFSEEEAVAFLKTRTGKDDEQAKDLAKCLGYFPLALEQAAAYISENNSTCQEYIDLFNEWKTDMFNEKIHITDYDKTINITWKISIDKITDESAKQMFYMCAYFAPDKIPVDIFVRGQEVLPEPLKEDITNKLKQKRIIKELTNYSLLKYEDNFLSMHRLLQEVVQKSHSDDIKWLEYCLSLMGKVIGWIEGDKASIDEFKLALSHIIAISEKSKEGFTDKENLNKIIYLFNQIGVGYYILGDYIQALEYYKKALAIDEKVYGKDHPETATSYNNIGLVYNTLGEPAQALEYHNKALAIKEKVYVKDHPETATSYNNIGSVYDELGDYQRALEYYNKALAIREKVYGKDHPDTAISYNNIGYIYYELSNYTQALEYYNKALATFEKVYGEDHPDTVISYNNIGLVYDSLGETTKALEYHKKALSVREKVYGEYHPDTAYSYNNIGAVYYKLNKSDQALDYYSKALTILEKVYGKDHHNTKTVKENIELLLNGGKSST